jgi:hypothetical protein
MKTERETYCLQFARSLTAVLIMAFGSAFAAQAPKSNFDPQQALDGVKDEVSPLNNQGTTGLDNYVEKAIRDLHRKVEQGVAKLKTQKQDAKRKADDAAKAAEAARDAAANCKTENDKKRIEALVKTAEQKQKDAQTSKDKADEMAKDLGKEVDEAGGNVDKHIEDLKNTLQKAYDAKMQEFKDQGLPDNAFPRTNFQGHYTQTLDKLNKAVDKVKQEGTWENGKYNASKEGMRPKLDSEAVKARELIRTLGFKNAKDLDALDPAGSLNKADTFLRAAKNYLDNCPQKVSAAPSAGTTPTEVTVAIDNRPEAVVNICPGQNVQDAATKIGLGAHEVVAKDDTGTIIKGRGDPKAVAQAAQMQNVKLCFQPEDDFCTIYTPLTAYRGHDHSQHIHSGAAVHNHEAPDPPLSWGVNPPKTVIRWSR